MSEWSSTGEKVFNRALSDLILKGNSKKAWELFNRAWPRQLIRASDTAIECGRAPPPTVCATMINSLAREDRVEAGFKLHALMIADKQPATSVVHTSMIYLATRRKEYFPHALGFFQEMSVLGLEIKTPVYDHLLYGCAKNAALETGMQLWKAVLTDKKLKPSVYTCCNYLWVLASVETPENRLSIHRPFVYDSIQYDKLAQAADEVLSYAKDQGISINGHLSNALLSLHVNHWCREAAEHVFWGMICTDLPQHERTPFSHEIILKLYDQLRDYDGARRVYENYIENFVSPRDIYYLPSTEKTSDINSDKTVSDLRSTRKLSESMADFSLKSNLTVSERLQEQRAKRLLKTIPLPYEGWRALARTASLCNFHDEALLHVQEMRANGHSPHLDDFKMLLMRFSQASRPDLCEGLAKICDKNATFPNPFIPWRHRSRAIGALLNTAYGFRAPKSATNAIQEIKRDEKNPNPEPPVSAKIQSDIERLKRSLSQLHLSPPLRLC